jgi:hypothetical protein
MTITTTSWKRDILVSLHGKRIGLATDGTLIVEGQPDGFTFVATPGAANVCGLSIQVVDNHGVALAGVREFEAWISDATTGAGLAASANTSELTCSTGALLGILTTEKAWMLQTDATGLCVAVITDTGKSLTNFAARIPGRGANAVAKTFVAANYT